MPDNETALPKITRKHTEYFAVCQDDLEHDEDNDNCALCAVNDDIRVVLEKMANREAVLVPMTDIDRLTWLCSLENTKWRYENSAEEVGNMAIRWVLGQPSFKDDK